MKQRYSPNSNLIKLSLVFLLIEAALIIGGHAAPLLTSASGLKPGETGYKREQLKAGAIFARQKAQEVTEEYVIPVLQNGQSQATSALLNYGSTINNQVVGAQQTANNMKTAHKLFGAKGVAGYGAYTVYNALR